MGGLTLCRAGGRAGHLSGIACELPRLQSARYTLTQRKGEADVEEVNFRGLVRRLDCDARALGGRA